MVVDVALGAHHEMSRRNPNLIPGSWMEGEWGWSVILVFAFLWLRFTFTSPPSLSLQSFLQKAAHIFHFVGLYNIRTRSANGYAGEKEGVGILSRWAGYGRLIDIGIDVFLPS